MNKKSGLSPQTARLLSLLLVLATVLLGFLAYQCVSTDQYKLYHDPYLTYSSRVEYYEAQAAQKEADAEQARAAGQDARALSYENTASVWRRNAEDGRDYLNRQHSGAISLTVGAVACLLLVVWLTVKSRKWAAEQKRAQQNEQA